MSEPEEPPEWVTLTGDESVIWSGGPANVRVAEEVLGEVVLVAAGLWLVFVQPAAIGAVTLPAFGFVPLGIAGVGLVVAGVGLLFGILTYLRFRAIEYLITTKELYVKRGLVSRSVENLRLERVQNNGFEQTVLQRLLGYGHVHVSTAGGGGVELRFKNVPDPGDVNGIITERLDRVRSR
ncbi:MAG: PH domain-containing protein [Natronomonas sp.]